MLLYALILKGFSRINPSEPMQSLILKSSCWVITNQLLRFQWLQLLLSQVFYWFIRSSCDRIRWKCYFI